MAATYTNMDAIWLADFASTLERMQGEATVTEADINRLRLVAEHIQAFDNRTGTYEDGRRDERLAMLGRSNLPPQSVELSPDLAKAMATIPVKKLPAATKTKKPRPEVDLGPDPFKDLILDIDFNDF